MKNIIIFTAGFHARATFRHLARRAGCRVVAFVDNNPAMHGRRLFDVPIESPRALSRHDFDVIAVPGRNQDAIIDQLQRELEIDESRIWRVGKSEVLPAPDELERRGVALDRLLREAMTVLDAAGSEYWAMHSGLLGLARGQDLGLFSDLDFCVAAEGFDALLPRFADAGIAVTSVAYPGSEALAQISLQAPPERPWDEPAMVDLHPISVGAVEATWPVNLRPLCVAADFFRGRGAFTYRGLTVPVPLRSEHLLAELYGSDWRRPAETWNGRYAMPVPATSL